MFNRTSRNSTRTSSVSSYAKYRCVKSYQKILESFWEIHTKLIFFYFIHNFRCKSCTCVAFTRANHFRIYLTTFECSQAKSIATEGDFIEIRLHSISVLFNASHNFCHFEQILLSFVYLKVFLVRIISFLWYIQIRSRSATSANSNINNVCYKIYSFLIIWMKFTPNFILNWW